MKLSTRTYLEVIKDTLKEVITPELQSEGAKRALGIACGALDALIVRELATSELLSSALPNGLLVSRRLETQTPRNSNAVSSESFILGMEKDIAALQRNGGAWQMYGALLQTLEQLMRVLSDQGLRSAPASYFSQILAEAAEWENNVAQTLLKLATARESETSVAKKIPNMGIPFLQNFMRVALPAETDVEVSEFKRIPAGMVHDTYQFTLRSNKRVGEELILRAAKGPALAEINCFELHKEFALVKSLSSVGYLVPEPLWQGRNLPGTVGDFYVMRKASGSQNADLFGTESTISEAVLLDMAEKLAELHTLPLERLSAFIDQYDHSAVYSDSAQQATKRNLDRWCDCWQTMERQPSAIEVYVFSWLMGNLPANPDRACLVHSDFAPHNCLWESNKLTSVLDWEGAHFGDPAEDLAYIKPHIAARMDWAIFMAHYCAHGGQMIDDARLAYFACYGHMRAVVLGNVMLSRVERGCSRDIVNLQVDYSFLPRISEICLASVRGASG